MNDVFDKCRSWDRDRPLKAAGIYPFNHPIAEVGEGTEVVVGGRRVVMAGSNDYLGLATDPRVKAGAIRAVRRFGSTCSGSRLLNGTRSLHEELEHRLAAFLGREAVVVVSTGFQTNLALAALLGPRDVVFADRHNHASLVDAVLLGSAAHRRYRHGDMAHLGRLLASADPDAGKLILTDSVFSVEGDLCDLPGVVRLAAEHGARVVLDCAHDLGLLGAHGRGAPEHYGLEAEVDLVTGTFSKSFASLGGLLAGPADVINYLRHVGRSVLFSAAMTPAAVGAAMAALDVVEQEPERRWRVLDLAEEAHNGLRALGFDTGRSATPVVPVRVGDETLCFRFWAELLDAGVFTNAFTAPAAPGGAALIRASFTATHTDAQLDRVLDAFAVVGRRLGIIPPAPPTAYEPVRIARPALAVPA
ncbi:8-amino-7-oxononanoate synthase [Streptoalloteichus tenebrarius]|uniref:8-amino-7-oxononanoate synthase n=1 Tax=Streptoalloteichus tenebrarius (strain ATCC 17920 / DSM 40477 / JCM 4838 / CBS 697.72 / NBRC 16177 / NCIMB 11028 / NRRL B-12390 / A12253. 1 / ISP 5477) TaxID=1933 RepID=A0ABT1I119_STRSD|nr:aminotransferase class I/II-fold pyridoxal phosphate-dependent enzyme [Streptoalloteichus tenebrarius]MCP2261478.1 8-amino-7-oxononanoate synthase [Streptoalloteichus tenebrarius]BFE99714.1 pyridoxal phosphate-dependent aminotransferase family protein [Streptoalloteichus tenebrarius]